MTPEAIRAALPDIVAPGLVSGIGKRTPGGVCVMAAIAWAEGGDHSDAPACVAKPDRGYAIAINDGAWESDAARAEALLPLALAAVGTAGTDRKPWLRALREGTIRRVLPMQLRKAADAHPDETHRVALRAAADRCTAEGTPEAAQAADAAADAAYAAYVAAYDAAYAASAASADAAADAAAYAAYAASAASADDAAYDAAAARYGRDPAMLRESVAVALDAYRKTQAGGAS